MALGDLAPVSPSTSTEAGGPPAGLQAQAASGPLHTISAPRVFSGWLLFMTSPLTPPTHRTWVPRPPHLKASAPQSPCQSLPHVPAVSFVVLLTTGATVSICNMYLSSAPECQLQEGLSVLPPQSGESYTYFKLPGGHSLS